MQHDVGGDELMAHEIVESDSLRRFDVDENLSLVLVRNEAFGNDQEQPNGCRENDQRHHHGRRTIAQHPSQATLIERQHAIEHAFRPLIELAVMFFFRRLEEAAREQRRQRERDESGDENRRADRHREFVKETAEDAAHEKDGDENRRE